MGRYSALSFVRHFSAVYSSLSSCLAARSSCSAGTSSRSGSRTSAGDDILDLGPAYVALLGYVLDVDVVPVLAYLYLADLCLYSSLDASLIATADLRYRLRQSRDSGGQYHGQHSR